MSRYAVQKSLHGWANDTLIDEDNIGYLYIPANRECEVQDCRVIIQTKSATADSYLEFVEVTDADAIWAKGATTGADDSIVQMTPEGSGGSSFPITIAADTSDRIFALKLDKAPSAGALWGFELKYSL